MNRPSVNKGFNALIKNGGIGSHIFYIMLHLEIMSTNFSTSQKKLGANTANKTTAASSNKEFITFNN